MSQAAKNSNQPSRLERKALSFFRRTRGISDLLPIYREAMATYPGLGEDAALEALYTSCVAAERRQAADVGDTATSEELAGIGRLITLQSP